MLVYVRVCVRASVPVRACMRVCGSVRACMHVRVCVCAHPLGYEKPFM